jgi:hypothetical protein
VLLLLLLIFRERVSRLPNATLPNATMTHRSSSTQPRSSVFDTVDALMAPSDAVMGALVARSIEVARASNGALSARNALLLCVAHELHDARMSANDMAALVGTLRLNDDYPTLPSGKVDTPAVFVLATLYTCLQHRSSLAQLVRLMCVHAASGADGSNAHERIVAALGRASAAGPAAGDAYTMLIGVFTCVVAARAGSSPDTLAQTPFLRALLAGKDGGVTRSITDAVMAELHEMPALNRLAAHAIAARNARVVIADVRAGLLAGRPTASMHAAHDAGAAYYTVHAPVPAAGGDESANHEYNEWYAGAPPPATVAAWRPRIRYRMCFSNSVMSSFAQWSRQGRLMRIMWMDWNTTTADVDSGIVTYSLATVRHATRHATITMHRVRYAAHTVRRARDDTMSTRYWTPGAVRIDRRTVHRFARASLAPLAHTLCTGGNNDAHVCANAHCPRRRRKTHACAGCRIARYCSTMCQSLDWRGTGGTGGTGGTPPHADVCRAARALRVRVTPNTTMCTVHVVRDLLAACIVARK